VELALARVTGENLIETYYKDILPALRQETLDRLCLHAPHTPTPHTPPHTHKVCFGSGVTEFIERIVSSVRPKNVLIPQNEFIASSRLVTFSNDWKCYTIRNFYKRNELGIRFPPTERQDGLDVVIFSHIDSCTQVTLTPQEITTIIDQFTRDTVIIIDITQSFMNVPINWSQIIAHRSNVFLVGSMIKHARCGEGLGFIVYHHNNKYSRAPPKAGWTSGLSGLSQNTTYRVDETIGGVTLIYDEGMEWNGGTPCHFETAHVARGILETLPPLPDQHAYVKTLHDYFYDQLDDDTHNKVIDKFRRQATGIFSNTICIKMDNLEDVKLICDNIQGIDYKQLGDDGTRCEYILRIGFGIHNLQTDVDKLIEQLQKTCNRSSLRASCPDPM
jgi:selenocysteine lyase/cysteine desulfurase